MLAPGQRRESLTPHHVGKRRLRALTRVERLRTLVLAGVKSGDRQLRSGKGGLWPRLLLFASLALTTSPGKAHDGRMDADPANDWIDGLANGNGASCCGSNDCYPLPPGALQLTPKTSFSVEIGGHWFVVPEYTLLRDSSPDGRAWVCPHWKSVAGGFMYVVEGVRCVLLPPPM
jgi:hypothetical protein